MIGHHMVQLTQRNNESFLMYNPTMKRGRPKTIWMERARMDIKKCTLSKHFAQDR